MTFTPSPGIFVVQEIETKSSLYTGDKPKSKLLVGKVLAVGEVGITKFGAAVQPPCKVDDIVVFLTYAETGEYDILEIQGDKYYFVEFLDHRANITKDVV